MLDKDQQRVPVGLQCARTAAAGVEHAEAGRGGLDIELAIAHARDDRSRETPDKALKAVGAMRTAAHPIADDTDRHPPRGDPPKFFDAL